MEALHTHDLSCPCGAAQAEVTAMPTQRFFCHCTICQSLYKAPFADVTILRADAVSVTTPGAVGFNKYKAPPALDRGLCTACEKPLLGFLHLPLLPDFAFISAANYREPDLLPEPTMHIWYRSRQADVDDGLKKVSGPLMSNLVLAGPMLKTAFG